MKQYPHAFAWLSRPDDGPITSWLLICQRCGVYSKPSSRLGQEETMLYTHGHNLGGYRRLHYHGSTIPEAFL
jgi:hypothetical protein